MNTMSAFPADENRREATGQRILVWDAPVRIFHWLMVACFAGAWITAESERWRLAHITLGYTMAGLVAFRLVWGLIGTRYARFGNFVRGPATIVQYLRNLIRGRPDHYTGHNPAGALAIIALIGLTIVVTASGWANFNELGGKLIEELHEAAASLMLALVGVHVAGALVSSWLHRENLIGAMITGRKAGRPDDAVRRSWRMLAALMLVVVLVFWWRQWASAPAGGATDRPVAAAKQNAHSDD